MRSAFILGVAPVLLWGSGMVLPLSLCLCPAMGPAVESAFDPCCPLESEEAAQAIDSIDGGADSCCDCRDVPMQLVWARGSGTSKGDETPGSIATPAVACQIRIAGVGLHCSTVHETDPPFLSLSRSFVLRC